MGALAATRSYRAADVERAQFTKRATPRGETENTIGRLEGEPNWRKDWD